MNERDMLDRILEEGIRLKAKCKQLRCALLEQEQRLSDEKRQSAQQKEELLGQVESRIAEIQAQHYLEMAHAQEYRVLELEDLQRQVLSAEEDNQLLRHGMDEAHEEIKRLQQDRQLAENRLDEARRSVEQEHRYKAGYKDGLLFQQNEFQLQAERYLKEKQQLIRERDDWQKRFEELEVRKDKEDGLQAKLSSAVTPSSTNDQIGSSVPPSCAVSTSEKDAQTAVVCLECPVKEEVINRLQQSVDDITHERQRICDEVGYYREETTRLEKQVSLMKAELQGWQQRAVLSPDYRSVLRSEREQRKLIIL